MRIEQMCYFVEIARCQSIKKASSHLFITQQSLSQSVKNLEKELGIPLLLRSQNGIRLTEEGKLFLAFAEKVLKEQKIFRERLNQLYGKGVLQEVEGCLTIHAFGVYDYSILPRLLHTFRLQYPKISIKICPTDFVTLEEAFMENYDQNSIGLIVLPDVNSFDRESCFVRNRMVFFPLGQSEYVLCCSRHHPLTGRNPVSLEALKYFPMIYLGTNGFASGSIYEIMRHYGCPDVSVQLETLSINIWLDTIAGGDAVGFLHKFIYEDLLKTHRSDMEHISIVPLEQRFCNIIGYVVKEEHSATVDCFIELLCKKFFLE